MCLVKVFCYFQTACDWFAVVIADDNFFHIKDSFRINSTKRERTRIVSLLLSGTLFLSVSNSFGYKNPLTKSLFYDILYVVNHKEIVYILASVPTLRVQGVRNLHSFCCHILFYHIFQGKSSKNEMKRMFTAFTNVNIFLIYKSAIKNIDKMYNM